MRDQALILLVEDQEDDVVLIRKAFERAGNPNPLHVVRDGEDAVAYLSGSGKYGNRAEYPLPWLVLLDIKMPGMDGFELLQWIRQQPGFKNLIVIMLTSSDAIRDVNKAYACGANSFMVKPLEFENAVEVSRLIKQYWMQHNRFPEVEREAQEKSVRM